MSKPRRESEKPKLPLRDKPDDVWLDELRADCARAIVDYLKKANVNLDRQIKSLSRRELEGMAEACTTRWIHRVADRHVNRKPEDPIDPLAIFLA